MNRVFKALADPTRRQILEMLRSGDLTAGDIAENFAISKPSISHHLNLLKQADLVLCERQGQHLYYSLNMTVFDEVVKWLMDFNGSVR